MAGSFFRMTPDVGEANGITESATATFALIAPLSADEWATR